MSDPKLKTLVFTVDTLASPGRLAFIDELATSLEGLFAGQYNVVVVEANGLHILPPKERAWRPGDNRE